jgi:hypothetical protein
MSVPGEAPDVQHVADRLGECGFILRETGGDQRFDFPSWNQLRAQSQIRGRQ